MEAAIVVSGMPDLGGASARLARGEMDIAAADRCYSKWLAAREADELIDQGLRVCLGLWPAVLDASQPSPDTLPIKVAAGVLGSHLRLSVLQIKARLHRLRSVNLMQEASETLGIVLGGTAVTVQNRRHQPSSSIINVGHLVV